MKTFDLVKPDGVTDAETMVNHTYQPNLTRNCAGSCPNLSISISHCLTIAFTSKPHSRYNPFESCLGFLNRPLVE